jgi:hypothetical protein
MFLAGCGMSDPNAFHAGCDHFDGVQVSAGLTPTIGWTPNCAVNKIAVFHALTAQDPGGDPLVVGEEMWEVHSSQIAGNTIEPTARYGRVPAGTTEGAPVLALTAGQPYVVFVSVLALNGPSTGTRRFFTL